MKVHTKTNVFNNSFNSEKCLAGTQILQSKRDASLSTNPLELFMLLPPQLPDCNWYVTVSNRVARLK